jgi:hypothetical protein
LKALLARTAGPHDQGALQGALGSLRTVTAGIGSILFSTCYSLSISIQQPKVAGLPFFVAASVYVVSYFFTKNYLSHHDVMKTDVSGSVSLLGAASGGNDRGMVQLPNMSHRFFFMGVPPSEESTNLLSSSSSSSEGPANVAGMGGALSGTGGPSGPMDPVFEEGHYAELGADEGASSRHPTNSHMPHINPPRSNLSSTASPSSSSS